MQALGIEVALLAGMTSVELLYRTLLRMRMKQKVAGRDKFERQPVGQVSRRNVTGQDGVPYAHAQIVPEQAQPPGTCASRACAPGPSKDTFTSDPFFARCASVLAEIVLDLGPGAIGEIGRELARSDQNTPAMRRLLSELAMVVPDLIRRPGGASDSAHAPARK